MPGNRRIPRRKRLEHNLAKVGVEGSNPFARSIKVNYLRGVGHRGGWACPSPVFHGAELTANACSQQSPMLRLHQNRREHPKFPEMGAPGASSNSRVQSIGALTIRLAASNVLGGGPPLRSVVNAITLQGRRLFFE